MRILWVKTSPLHPLTRGGDLRTFHLLRVLHERHEITFAGMTADAAQQEGAALSSSYSTRAFWTHLKKASQKPGRLRFAAGAALNLVSSLPYAVERFSSRRWTRQLAHILDHHAFDVVVCDFLFPAASLPWDQKMPSRPWVLFQHNVESVIWERRAAKLSGVPKSYFTAQWHRMRDFEQRISGLFDSVLTVSEEDAATCRSLYQLTNVRGLQKVAEDAPHLALAFRLAAANHLECVAFGTEGGIFQGQGLPTIICGPGSIDQAHQPNEFVTRAQLALGAIFMQNVGNACAGE